MLVRIDVSLRNSSNSNWKLDVFFYYAGLTMFSFFKTKLAFYIIVAISFGSVLVGTFSNFSYASVKFAKIN